MVKKWRNWLRGLQEVWRSNALKIAGTKPVVKFNELIELSSTKCRVTDEILRSGTSFHYV